MPSLWTELLHLHGHLCDWRLVRRLVEAAPPTAPSPTPGAPTASLPPLRLCLGIGDGETHRQ